MEELSFIRKYSANRNQTKELLFPFGWNTGAALVIRGNSGNPHMLVIRRLQMNSLISVSEYKKEPLHFGLNVSFYTHSLTGTLWSNCDRCFCLSWCMITIIHRTLNIPWNKGSSCVCQTREGNLQSGVKRTGVCWCSKKKHNGRLIIVCIQILPSRQHGKQLHLLHCLSGFDTQLTEAVKVLLNL